MTFHSLPAPPHTLLLPLGVGAAGCRRLSGPLDLGLLPADPLELPYTPGVRAIGIGSLIMAVKLVQWAVALRGKVDACSEWQALACAQLEEARTGLRWLPLGALLTAAVEWVGSGTLYLQAVIGVCLLLLLGALTWLHPMAGLEPPSRP